MDRFDPHMIGDLKKSNSLISSHGSLFQGGHQLELEETGKQIAEICPSVPLVIRTTVGTLGKKPMLGDWLNFEIRNLRLLLIKKMTSSSR